MCNKREVGKQYLIDDDLKSKLLKYFSAIEEMTEELTSGNVGS